MQALCSHAPALSSNASSPPVRSNHPATFLLRDWLTQKLNIPVVLSWSQGRRTLFSYHRASDHLRLRLNRVFHAIGEAELEALARVLQLQDRTAMKLLRVFFERHASQHETHGARPNLRTQGRFYDLRVLLQEQNDLFFSGRSQANITWGRSSSRKGPKRSMQLGCFVPEQNLIRIHPRLDDPTIPRFFLSHVIYHELLHEVFGLGDARSHRRIHPPEFVLVEQGHPDYARSIAWEAQNLGRLLAQ